MGKHTDVIRVNFEYFEIDPQDAKSSMRLIAKVIDEDIPEDKREREFKISKSVSMNFMDGEDVKPEDVVVEVVSGAKFLQGYNYYTYTKETVFLAAKDTIDEILEIFKQGADEVGLIYAGGKHYIGPAAHEVRMETVLDIPEERTAAEIKTELKAYETPKNIHLATLRLVSRGMAAMMLKEYGHEVHTILARKNRTDGSGKKVIESHAQLNNTLTLLKRRGEQIHAALTLLGKNGFNPPSKHDLAERYRGSTYDLYFRTDLEDVKTFAKYIIEYIPEAKEILAALHSENIFTELKKTQWGEKRFRGLRIPILDMQAGSGQAFFEAFDELEFPGTLIGAELRSKEEIGQDDPRYLVMNNRNFLHYKGAFRSTFMNGKVQRAASSQILFLNPPYTADDLVAKESVLALRDEMMLTGLFPVKMESFLRQEIDGVIFNVSRALTGYTDPKTPERFLYVIGRRFSYRERNKNVQGSLIQTPKNKVYSIDTDDLDLAVTKMMNILDAERTIYDFMTHCANIYSYFSDKNALGREKIMSTALESAFKATERFMKNEKLLKSVLEANQEEILKKMSPMEVLRTEQVFPDMRFYKQGGDYDKMRFKDVINDIPLLVFYRSNYPRLYNLVEQVAEEMGIDMPIQKENVIPFSLSNPQKPKKKDKITNTNLGMLRLHYYPTMFDLSKAEDKGLLADIVLSIARGNAEARMASIPLDKLEMYRARLNAYFKPAVKLVTKNEVVVDGVSGDVAKREVLVFVDEYENDVGRLDVSLTDLYREMEARKIFDINDYIELAELCDEDKEKFIDNFYEYLVSILKQVDTNLDENDIEQSDIFKAIKNHRTEIYRAQRAFSQGKASKKDARGIYFRELKRFQQNFNLESFFDKQLVMPNIPSYIGSYLEDKAEIVDMGQSDSAAAVEEIGTLINSDVFRFYSDSEYASAKINEVLGKYGMDKEKQRRILTGILNDTSMLYTIKKSTLHASSKFAKTMIMTFYDLHSRVYSKNENKVDVYNKMIPFFFTSQLQLKPHQFNEAERFAAMRKEVKLELLLWEMRSGKSRAFLTTMFYLSMLEKKNSHIFLESKNILDIVTQSLESLPFVFFGMNVFLNTSSKIRLNPRLTSKALPGTLFPNIPKLARSMMTGQGQTAEMEAMKFTQNFEYLYERVQERFENGETIENIKRENADSAFLACLDICQ